MPNLKDAFAQYVAPTVKKFSFLFWIGLLVLVAFWRGGCIEYNPFKAHQDLIRQLQGKLTEQEKEIQRLNTVLGIAKSELVEQKTLQAKYDQLQKDKDDSDRAFDAFLKKNKLQIDSISNALFALQQEVKNGKGTATTDPKTGITSYAYEDADKRVHLDDPNIVKQGDETLTLNQHFRALGTVAVQKDGNLKTERVELEEVVPGTLGTYKTVGKAKLVDAEFQYAPYKPLKDTIWDWSLFLEAGLIFRDPPLTFGVGTNVLHFGKNRSWGLAVDMTTDFRSFSGTGFGMQLTYRPVIGSRKLNLAAGLGPYVSLTGEWRPYVGLLFIFY